MKLQRQENMSYCNNTQQQFAQDILNINDSSLLYGNNNDFSSNELLEVYHNNNVISLKEALSLVYPKLKKLVGNNFFNSLCNDYLKQYPLSKGYLIDYGKYMPKLISDDKRCNDYKFLIDIAKIEWGIDTIYHSAFNSGLDKNTLSLLDSNLDNIYIKIVDDIEVVFSKFAIFDIWDIKNDENLENIDINKEQNVLITRKFSNINIKQIDTYQAKLLTKLKQNNNLLDSVEYAEESLSNKDKFDIKETFRMFVDNKLIEKIYTI
jgi:hypothetical protein